MKPEMTCQRCLELLPSYVAGTLPAAESAMVAAHLATCAECRAELAQWQHLAQAVRAPQRAPQPALTFEQARVRLHAHLSAVAPPPSPASSGASSMQERTIASDINQPARVARRSYPVFAGLLLALVVVASLIFVVPRFRSSGTATPGAVCDVTRTTSRIPAYGSIGDLSFLSPQDGWGAGFTWNPPGNAGPQSLIVRLQHCRWQPVGGSMPGLALTSIAMTAPNDGWTAGFSVQPQSGATGSNFNFQLGGPVLLHDSDGVWQPVSLPPNGGGQLASFPTVRMISADDGWFLTELSTDRTHFQHMLLHLHEGTWQPVPLPSFITTTTLLSALNVVAPDACWLIGMQGTHYRVIHYQQGAWSQWQPPHDVSLSALAMASDHAGVAVGLAPISTTSPALGIWRATYDGTTWKTSSIPTATPLVEVRVAAWVPPDDLWVAGDTQNSPAPVMFHQHGQRVISEALPDTMSSIAAISMVSPTEGWAIASKQVSLTANSGFGKESLWYYHNGAWMALHNTP